MKKKILTIASIIAACSILSGCIVEERGGPPARGWYYGGGCYRCYR